MGVVRTFQHVRLFREMTVIENLLVAQHQHLKSGVFAGLLKPRPSAAPKPKRWRARRGWSASACWRWPTVRRATRPMGSSGGWRSLAAW